MSTDTLIVYPDGALEAPALLARLQPLLHDALVAAGFRQRESFQDLYECPHTDTALPHRMVHFGTVDDWKEHDGVNGGIGYVLYDSQQRIATIRIMSQRVNLCFAEDSVTRGPMGFNEYVANDEADVVEAINRVFVDAGAPELCLSTTYVLK